LNNVKIIGNKAMSRKKLVSLGLGEHKRREFEIAGTDNSEKFGSKGKEKAGVVAATGAL
jgi:hypothetical protein